MGTIALFCLVPRIVFIYLFSQFFFILFGFGQAMKNHAGINAVLIITLLHTLHIAQALKDDGNSSESNDAKGPWKSCSAEDGEIQVSREEMTGYSPFESYSGLYAPKKINNKMFYWSSKANSKRAEVGFQVCEKIAATKIIFGTKYYTATNLLRLYGLKCFSRMGNENGDNTKPACEKEYVEATVSTPKDGFFKGVFSKHHEFTIKKPKFFQAYGVEFPLNSIIKKTWKQQYATMRKLQVTKMNCKAPSSAENVSLDLFTIGLMKCEKHFGAVHRPSYT